jgi:hypothetical protein
MATLTHAGWQTIQIRKDEPEDILAEVMFLRTRIFLKRQTIVTELLLHSISK